MKKKDELNLFTEQENKNLQVLTELLEKMQTDDSPLLKIRIGRMYLEGKVPGIDEDTAHKTAVTYFNIALEAKCPDAYYAIASSCDMEQPEKYREPEKCASLYKMALDSDVIPAYLEFGRCLEAGYGVERDLETAFLCYKYAAEKGYVYAYRFLAECYAFGKGCEVDHKKSGEWYKKLIDETGLPEAMTIFFTVCA